MSVITGNSKIQFVSCVPFTQHPWASVYNHASWIVDDPYIVTYAYGSTPMYAMEDWEMEDAGLYAPTTPAETEATLGGYALGYRGCRTLFPSSLTSVYQLGGPWNNAVITDTALRNVAQSLYGVISHGVLPVVVSVYIDQDWSENFITQIINAGVDSLEKTVSALRGNLTVSGVVPPGCEVRSVFMFSDSDGFGTPVFSLTVSRMQQILSAALAAGATNFILWNGAEYRLRLMAAEPIPGTRAAMLSDFLNAHSLLLSMGTSAQQAAFAALCLSSTSQEELWRSYAQFVDPFLFQCARWARGLS